MRRAWLVILTAASGLVGGCFGDSGQPFVSPERLDKGLVLVFTGIEGRSGFNRDICHGLDSGGVDRAIELVDWTCGVPGMFLVNLRSEVRNRQAADEIAQRVLRYRMQYPRRPVYLVGQSGGSAIALWVAEALPAGVKVDGIVLLAAAISPTYPLEMALANSQRGIVNFYSPRDWFFLTAGTTLAGTMDGAHTSSAGRVGFDVPASASRPQAYQRLYQVGWNAGMEQSGHTGIHLTSGSRSFVARYVAPLVLMDGWSQEAVDQIVAGNFTVVPPTATRPATTAPATRPAAGRRFSGAGQAV